MIFKYQPIEHLAEGEYKQVPLKDGSHLEMIIGDGSHTHIGNGFIAIKDEATGEHIHWNVPMTESQRDFYGTGNNRPPY